MSCGGSEGWKDKYDNLGVYGAWFEACVGSDQIDVVFRFGLSWIPLTLKERRKFALYSHPSPSTNLILFMEPSGIFCFPFLTRPMSRSCRFYLGSLERKIPRYVVRIS